MLPPQKTMPASIGCLLLPPNRQVRCFTAPWWKLVFGTAVCWLRTASMQKANNCTFTRLSNSLLFSFCADHIGERRYLTTSIKLNVLIALSRCHRRATCLRFRWQKKGSRRDSHSQTRKAKVSAYVMPESWSMQSDGVVREVVGRSDGWRQQGARDAPGDCRQSARSVPGASGGRAGRLPGDGRQRATSRLVRLPLPDGAG